MLSVMFVSCAPAASSPDQAFMTARGPGTATSSRLLAAGQTWSVTSSSGPATTTNVIQVLNPTPDVYSNADLLKVMEILTGKTNENMVQYNVVKQTLNLIWREGGNVYLCKAENVNEQAVRFEGRLILGSQNLGACTIEMARQ